MPPAVPPRDSPAPAARPRGADRHSRLVGWLKITLPLLALALLSTLFLVARRIDTDQAIPYAAVDVEELARDQRIGAPDYAGVGPGGEAVTFEAASVRPRGARAAPAPDDMVPGSATAIEPRARIALPGGVTLTVAAASGWLSPDAGVAGLVGAVDMQSSDGFRLRSGRIEADLRAAALTSPGPVAGTAPFGTLEAGSMALRRDAQGAHLLGFDGGVKLVYRPAQGAGQ